MDKEKFQDLMLDHFAKLFNEVQDVKAELSKVKQSQARMEHDHGEKLAALAEGHKMLMGTMAEHTEILNEHSRILNEHSNILNEHSNILNEHSNILNDHTNRLERIEEKVSSQEIKIKVLDETKANKRKAK